MLFISGHLYSDTKIADASTSFRVVVIQLIVLIGQVLSRSFVLPFGLVGCFYVTLLLFRGRCVPFLGTFLCFFILISMTFVYGENIYIGIKKKSAKS